MFGGSLFGPWALRRARSTLRRFIGAFVTMAMVVSLAAHATHAHQTAPSPVDQINFAMPDDGAPPTSDGSGTASPADCCQCCAPNIILPAVIDVTPRARPAALPFAVIASYIATHRTIESPPPRA
ncbi:MAG: hypothetical protein IPK81_11800 [Rhodospirillales bacterium]|nr:MAG: hypothetical protein IPK81_11800 [Rhodospirillales bacterium]